MRTGSSRSSARRRRRPSSRWDRRCSTPPGRPARAGAASFSGQASPPRISSRMPRQLLARPQRGERRHGRHDRDALRRRASRRGRRRTGPASAVRAPGMRRAARPATSPRRRRRRRRRGRRGPGRRVPAARSCRNSRASASTNAAALRCVTATPFGFPVEPEVKMIQASSLGCGRRGPTRSAGSGAASRRAPRRSPRTPRPRRTPSRHARPGRRRRPARMRRRRQHREDRDVQVGGARRDADADPVATPDAARAEGDAEGVDLAQQRGVVEHLTAVVDGRGARVGPGGGLEDVAQGALRGGQSAEVDRREGRAVPGRTGPGRGLGGGGEPAAAGRGPSGRLCRLGAGTCGTRVVAGSAAGAVPDGRGGTTGIRSVSPSVAGTRTAPGYARCAAGRAAVVRTCVLAGSPGRTHRGDDRDAGRRGSRTPRRRRRSRRGGTTGTRAVMALGLRRGDAVRARRGNREARCRTRAGHGPRRRARSRDAPDRVAEPAGGRSSEEVRGAGTGVSRVGEGRRAGTAGTRVVRPRCLSSGLRTGSLAGRGRGTTATRRVDTSMSGPPDGHSLNVIMSRCPGRPFVRAAAPVVRASLPMRSPSPTAGSFVATPRDRTLPVHPDNRATSDGYLSAIHSSAFQESTAITRTDQKNGVQFGSALSCDRLSRSRVNRSSLDPHWNRCRTNIHDVAREPRPGKMKYADEHLFRRRTRNGRRGSAPCRTQPARGATSATDRHLKTGRYTPVVHSSDTVT